ncbi:MAG: hypothetical protein KAX49_00565 [Halanaerobiales bacterium]|nr:hypothetical protein [Halanaerobiales bacterium]
MSKIIKASQYRQEEKLRKLFAEKSADHDLVKEVLDREVDQSTDTQNLIDEAKFEVETLYAQAEQEILAAKEAGYQEGYNEGVQKGLQTGFEEFINHTEEFIKNLESETARTQMVLSSQIEGISARLIRLSVQIAKRIIGHQVELKPELIINQIENILSDISRVKTLAIRVNPSQLEIVRGFEERFLSLTQGIEGIDFVVDHSLEPSDCIIETDSGGVDATIDTQLEIILASLLEENRVVKDDS